LEREPLPFLVMVLMLIVVIIAGNFVLLFWKYFNLEDESTERSRMNLVSKESIHLEERGFNTDNVKKRFRSVLSPSFLLDSNRCNEYNI